MLYRLLRGQEVTNVPLYAFTVIRFSYIRIDMRLNAVWITFPYSVPIPPRFASSI